MQNIKLGLNIVINKASLVQIIRKTKETEINLVIEESKKRENKINTGIMFFNHMIEGISSRAYLNIDITFKSIIKDIFNHAVIEDVGLTFGRAIREMIDARRVKGVCERGDYTVAFDEALVNVVLAFDGRAYCFLKGEVEGIKKEYVEGVQATSLKQFFEGFAQGSGCVVYIEFLYGEDSHHSWECAFKAFGEALRESIASCPFRAGTTIGLKGTGMETKL